MVLAQNFGMPPGNVGNDSPQGGDNPQGGGDDASLVVRVGQLEAQVRDLNGKIEQLQFANRQLQEQLQKFQADVEYRFQELSHKGGMKPLPKRSDASDPALNASANVASTDTHLAPQPNSSGRDDAFDPTKNPNAPGAPRSLGAVGPGGAAGAGVPGGGDAGQPNGQVASNDDGPINLLSSAQSNDGGGASPQPNQATTSTTGGEPPRPNNGSSQNGYATTPGGTVIADAESGDATKEELDVALGYIKQKDYDSAERSLTAFIAKNPKGRKTSDAIYYLGEAYYLRGRNREAAEQYLKISANYASSPRAPEAMLRLGEALHALGDKEQACAAFGEVPKRYPNAAASIKANAVREAKKAQC
jgi:tol-pal system protein YbgF